MKKLYKRLMIVGIAIGVFICTLVVGAVQSAFVINRALEEIENRGYKDYTVFFTIAPRVYVDANLGQIEYIKSAMPKDIEFSYEVANIFPRKPEEFKIVDTVEHEGEVIVSSIIATGTNYLSVSNYKLVMGRFLDEKDIQNKTKVCVIHEALYNLLGKKENLQLKIYGENYDVVGVVKGSASEASTIIMGKYAEDTTIFITTSAASEYIMGISQYSQGLINRAIMRAPSKYTKEDIKSYLTGLSLISDGDKKIKLVLMEGGEQEKMRLINALNIVKKVLMISALVLFLSGLNIIQIATANVYDIKKQLGLKMALGATRLDIMKEMSGNIIICTLKGGYIGITMYAILYSIINSIISDYSKYWSIIYPLFKQYTGYYRISFDLNTVIIGMAMAFILGILSSVLPAVKAASINPITVLRKD